MKLSSVHFYTHLGIVTVNKLMIVIHIWELTWPVVTAQNYFEGNIGY